MARHCLSPLLSVQALRRTVQGLASVRSGQAPSRSLISDRSVRRGDRGDRGAEDQLDSRMRCNAASIIPKFHSNRSSPRSG